MVSVIGRVDPEQVTAMDIQDIVSLTALVRVALGLTVVVLLAWWMTHRHDTRGHGARPWQIGRTR